VFVNLSTSATTIGFIFQAFTVFDIAKKKTEIKKEAERQRMLAEVRRAREEHLKRTTGDTHLRYLDATLLNSQMQGAKDLERANSGDSSYVDELEAAYMDGDEDTILGQVRHRRVTGGFGGTVAVVQRDGEHNPAIPTWESRIATRVRTPRGTRSGAPRVAGESKDEEAGGSISGDSFAGGGPGPGGASAGGSGSGSGFGSFFSSLMPRWEARTQAQPQTQTQTQTTSRMPSLWQTRQPDMSRYMVDQPQTQSQSQSQPTQREIEFHAYRDVDPAHRLPMHGIVSTVAEEYDGRYDHYDHYGDDASSSNDSVDHRRVWFSKDKTFY
jgi:hypothetical protein